MELAVAREHYKKKKYGRCINCKHNDMAYNEFLNRTYCNVREEYMYKDLAVDWFKIKFCRYYECKQGVE